MSSKAVMFEHALNDHTRAALRLEALFKRLSHCQKNPKTFSHHFAIQTLLQLLNLMDRPDLKGKLITSLQYHADLLSAWAKNPQVNQDVLANLLDQIQQHSHTLKTTTHLPGFELSQHPFIKMLRQHSGHPGGIATDGLPCYQLWINHEQQAGELIQAWQNALSPLAETIELMLSLTRQSQDMREQVAEGGLFKQALDPEHELSLIRIEVFDYLYPEFSVGKHQLAIYFFSPTFTEGVFDSKKLAEKTVFRLSLC